jgi:hypothetical protein
MGLRKLLIFVFLVFATLLCSATVLPPSRALQTTPSSFQKHDGHNFRTINLYFTACKSFSGFILLSDVVNYFHFDHNTYSRKISLFGSSDITLLLKSPTYFKGLEKYKGGANTKPSYSFFCKLQL